MGDLEAECNEIKQELGHIKDTLRGDNGSGVLARLYDLEDMVWKHRQSGKVGLAERVEALETQGRERRWLVRLIFGLIALQALLGPEALSTFLRGFLGAP